MNSNLNMKADPEPNLKALSVLIMETEPFAVLSASIGFIYNYQHMFAMYARRVVLIELLFDNCFMRLFAHWEVPTPTLALNPI